MILKSLYRHIKKHDLHLVLKKKWIVFSHFYLNRLSDENYLIELGKLNLSYEMNLKNPKTLNEKINYYKLHYHSDLASKVVDKIEAKDYVAKKGLKDLCVKTIAVYNSVSELDLDKLPDKFVIKNTIDSGGVFVCRDKKTVTKKQIIKKLSSNLSRTIIKGKHILLEDNYVKNRNRIIVEEVIETPNGNWPIDYKFFCFNGEPKFLFVATDREKNCCFDFFDTDFNWMDVRNNHPNSEKKIAKPENFDKMLLYARILSKDFPHVRVDFYNVNGRIFFGELTFYHYGGMVPFDPFKYDQLFGEYFDITSLK